MNQISKKCIYLKNNKCYAPFRDKPTIVNPNNRCKKVLDFDYTNKKPMYVKNCKYYQEVKTCNK